MDTLNADFTVAVQVNTQQQPWQPSPAPGVERKPLDRVGAEQARATSVVRYAAGSQFPAHDHPAGEEILVLSGCFEDERGKFGQGTYLRNPPGYRHSPRSNPGCQLLVKLRQFAPDDQRQVTLDVGAFLQESAPLAQVYTELAHRHAGEEVWFVRLRGGGSWQLPIAARQGCEIFCLTGDLYLDEQRLQRHDWARWPSVNRGQLTTGLGGAAYIKVGHLASLLPESEE